MGHSSALAGHIILKPDTPKEILTLIYDLYDTCGEPKRELPNHPFFSDSRMGRIFLNACEEFMFKNIDFPEKRGIFTKDDITWMQIKCANKYTYGIILSFLNWIEPYTKDVHCLWIEDEDAWTQQVYWDESQFTFGDRISTYGSDSSNYFGFSESSPEPEIVPSNFEGSFFHGAKQWEPNKKEN